MNLSKAVTFEFRDCQFRGNHATGNDGGAARIGGDGAEVSFVNCIFSGNSANEDGGVIYQIYGGEVTLTNCTLSANTCGGEGAAVYSWKISDTKMVNCVIRDLGDNEIHKQDGSTVTVEYSCISGGYAGEGNIDTDPLFVDPDGADDIFGTEDDNLRLQPGSPCIDAADNTAVPYDVTTDLDGNPRFVDDPDTEDTGFGDPPIVDMGAYEFQVDNCPADVNDDGTVDIDDLFDVLSHWGEGAGPCDVNDDGVVDIDDIFAVLADWGPCP
jgi:hypothetical protein